MSNRYLPSLNAEMGELIRKIRLEARTQEGKGGLEGRSILTVGEEEEVSSELESGVLVDKANIVIENNLGDIKELIKQFEQPAEEFERLRDRTDQVSGNANNRVKIINQKSALERRKEKIILSEEKSILEQLEGILYKGTRTTLFIMEAETKAAVKRAENEEKAGVSKAAVERAIDEKKAGVSKAAVERAIDEENLEEDVGSFAQGASWRPPEDWELHYQYILEIFNPQTSVVVGPAKPESELKPGEELDRPPLSTSMLPGLGFLDFTSLIPILDVGWVVLQLMDNTTKVTYRRSARAKQLKDVDVTVDASAQVTSKPRFIGKKLERAINLEAKKLINAMANSVSNLGYTLQSDSIIELYDRREKIKYRDYYNIFFHYSYTDYERRSKFYYMPKNMPERSGESQEGIQGRPQKAAALPALLGPLLIGPVVSAMASITGAIASGLINASVRFGIELYPLVVFLVPEKCQTPKE